MDNSDKKTLRFSYLNTIASDEKEYGTTIKVAYSSRTEMDSENCSLLHNELKNNLDELCDDKVDDTINIVKNIREITKDLDEVRLDVSVNRYSSGEYVYYKKGLVDSCGAYKEMYDDNIFVFNNREGVDIRFKKAEYHLNSEEDINNINKEMYDLYRIVVTLNNMIKSNEKTKSKLLTKKIK